MKKFTFMVIGFAITFSSLGLYLTLSQNDLISSMNLILFLSITLANILFAIFTMTFVFIRFRSKGMSTEIKKGIK